QRHRQRPRRVRRPPAGADPLAGAGGGARRRRAARRGRGDRGGCARGGRARLSVASVARGDRVLVSGSIGEHGTAVMLARDEFELDAEVVSDTRPLWPAVDALLDACGPALRAMRDATRGGVATVLNEVARMAGVAVLVR